jgi:hypothetical protein
MKGINPKLKSIVEGNAMESMLANMRKPPIKSVSKSYSGTVVDNKGPDLLGKCRIRIKAVYPDEIPDDQLPWAVPLRSFVGSKMGDFIVPPVGATVMVEFENDSIYSPVYSMKTSDANSMSIAGIGDDYPDTMVMMETDNGDYVKINRKTKMMIVRHSTGIMIGIDHEGNIKIDTTPGDTGTIEMEIEGNLDIHSKANINLEADSHVHIKGSTVCVTAKSMVDVHGPGLVVDKNLQCNGQLSGVHTHLGNVGVPTGPPIAPVVIPPGT